MKKILLSIVLFTVFVSSSYSQKVMGIDINTTSKKFELAMSKKGYKPSEKVSGHTIYNVIYAGYKGTNANHYNYWKSHNILILVTQFMAFPALFNLF